MTLPNIAGTAGPEAMTLPHVVGKSFSALDAGKGRRDTEVLSAQTTCDESEDSQPESESSTARPQLRRSQTSQEHKPRLPAIRRGASNGVAAAVAANSGLARRERESHRKVRTMDAETKKLVMAGILKDRFCANLPADSLEILVANMVFYGFNQGETIMNEGGHGAEFYVLQHGSLEVSAARKVLNTLGAGDAFGAIALVYDCPRTATVRATSASSIWGVDGATFREVLKERSKQRYVETRKFLDSITLLDGLSAQQKDLVGQMAIVEEVFDAGCCVISEGETTTAMYCVVKGELSVIVGGTRDRSGKVTGGKKISTLRSGDCFGERAALYSEARSSTVVADVQTEVVCICIPQLREALGEDLATFFHKTFLQSVLQKLPVLAHLSLAQQARLIDSMHVKVLGPGTKVEDESRLVVVIDGEMICKRSAVTSVLKRGEWCQDETLLQLHELCGGGGQDRGSAGGSTASSSGSRPPSRQLCKNPSSKSGLSSGSAGCTMAVLTKEAMVAALVDFGFAGISKGNKEEHIFDYIKKLLGARKVPVFRDLAQDQIDNLVNTLVLKRYHQGAVIFKQGEVGHSFFVLASGEAHVSIDGKTIRTLGKGACFGERAVLFDEPRSATVQVSSASAEIWSLDRKEFRRVLSKEMREELVKRIQLQETSVSLKSLRHVRSIGAGSFGSVRLVEHRRTGLRYALKRVRKEEGEIPEDVQRECNLLAELDHPFVVRLVKTFETRDSVYMLTELITGGQMFVQTNKKMGVLNRRQAQFYVASLVIILEVLHDRAIVYRDLKPENVMLDEQGYLKLVDFGLAKKLDNEGGRTFSLVGTLYYLAPEVIRGKGYATEVDIWALGVLFYELVTGRLPYGDGKRSEHDILVSILEDPLKFPGKYSDNTGKKLISGLLNRRSECRLGIRGWDEVKRDKYFKAGINGNIFSQIIGRELEAPVIPEGEEFPSEAELQGKVTLSDAEELGGAEDKIVSRVLQIFRKVKIGGDGRLNKQQLAKVLRVLDAETFNEQVVNRIWTAMGMTGDARVQLEDFLSWLSADDGQAFSKAIALEDIHS